MGTSRKSDGQPSRPLNHYSHLEPRRVPPRGRLDNSQSDTAVSQGEPTSQRQGADPKIFFQLVSVLKNHNSHVQGQVTGRKIRNGCKLEDYQTVESRSSPLLKIKKMNETTSTPCRLPAPSLPRAGKVFVFVKIRSVVAVFK